MYQPGLLGKYQDAGAAHQIVLKGADKNPFPLFKKKKKITSSDCRVSVSGCAFSRWPLFSSLSRGCAGDQRNASSQQHALPTQEDSSELSFPRSDPAQLCLVCDI